MAPIASEFTRLRYHLQDLQINVSGPINLYCDNQAALHIVVNSIFHERRKHIEIDCRVAREKFNQDKLLLFSLHHTPKLQIF